MEEGYKIGDKITFELTNQLINGEILKIKKGLFGMEKYLVRYSSYNYTEKGEIFNENNNNVIWLIESKIIDKI